MLAAALAGATAVALGAFGAHALLGVLDERALVTWHTAVDYQFWHALALLAVGVLACFRITTALRVATLAFVVGIVLFCGSLYALALGAPRWIGAVTPLGGIALIIGWLALAVHAGRDAAPQ
ncbi:DUF423 domain-containing protein [Dokdonella soli]|uniref:DUF423 domain-containing protein n=2 Tax=Dokdonella soli TaxID=529810 RepID=A0ABN1IBK9_9GAMM